ncbi:TRAP transporter substrate-binding protein [Pararhodospirillum photometricum]|uniref:Twin-arginine translocation pathway signal n=1 Tax=Pararhodospirillum photometricum DSM 122 TaxID=1150469 RepID=H6SRF3_PARPM|nr:TRAP transporter substrate-binding protein [Pararhodospirillum photometricum]CCG07482.1 Twin-arginine translocation pathway signal [Pararhodospirillum photometricum DSM 122]
MKRRDFLSGAAAAGAVAAASSFPRPALAQGTRELKMVTAWPKNFPGLGTAAERLGQRIARMTGGRFTVKVFAAGELVPAFEAFDAVSSGTAEMYHGSEYYWQGKSKAFNFFSNVPFGLTGPEINAWLYHGGGQALWDELAAGFKVKGFAASNTGVQMGGWYNREINTLEDFKGLKIRMPGLGGEVMRRLGAAVVNLPGGEIFPALQSGAIDATEWVGPWNDLAFGFYKVAKYYYSPGFHEPGATISAGFNLDFWNSLSAEDKAIMEAACGAENDYGLAEFNARNADALRTLVNDHKVQHRLFPDEAIRQIGKLSGDVVREVAAADPMTTKVYESFLAFRKKMVEWGRLADQAYFNARALPFEY